MACKNITEALLEDVIEITWMFDGLIESGEIKSWNELTDEFCGSDGIKQEIRKIAENFEKKYPFKTAWEDTDLDYIEEIEKFARKKLEGIFRRQENEEYEPDMIDGITTCCGYDFGTDGKRGKYCPICGKRLVFVK